MSGSELNVFLALHSALDVHLRTLAEMPMRGSEQLLQVENVNFTAPEGSLWLRSEFLAGEPVGGTLGDRRMTPLLGTFIVTVFGPRGDGAGPVRSLSDAVARLYPVGTRLAYGDSHLTITKCWSDGAIQDLEWYYIPVNMRWKSHTLQL